MRPTRPKTPNLCTWACLTLLHACAVGGSSRKQEAGRAGEQGPQAGSGQGWPRARRGQTERPDGARCAERHRSRCAIHATPQNAMHRMPLAQVSMSVLWATARAFWSCIWTSQKCCFLWGSSQLITVSHCRVVRAEKALSLTKGAGCSSFCTVSAAVQISVSCCWICRGGISQGGTKLGHAGQLGQV